MKKGKLQIDTYSLVPVLQNVLKKKRQMRVCMCVFTHFLVNIDSLCLLCVCVCVCTLKSCPTLCNPMDCSLPDSSVYGIFQARILKWVDMPSSRGSYRPRDWICISCVSGTGRRIL